MATPVERTRGHGVVSRVLHGSRERIAGNVYGTIVVLGVLAAGAESASIDAWELDVLMVATVLVLWLAHVYAHAIAESLTTGRTLSAGGIRALAHREISIVVAAAGPALALLLAPLGILADETAVWLALGLGTLTLAVQGLRYARIAGLGLLATLAVVGLNLFLGLLIVGLKVVIEH